MIIMSYVWLGGLGTSSSAAPGQPTTGSPIGPELGGASYLSGFTKPLVTNPPDAELWGPIVVPPVPSSSLSPTPVLADKENIEVRK